MLLLASPSGPCSVLPVSLCLCGGGACWRVSSFSHVHWVPLSVSLCSPLCLSFPKVFLFSILPSLIYPTLPFFFLLLLSPFLSFIGHRVEYIELLL